MMNYDTVSFVEDYPTDDINSNKLGGHSHRSTSVASINPYVNQDDEMLTKIDFIINDQCGNLRGTQQLDYRTY